MEPFDIVTLIFTGLVFISILVGSIAICVRCIQVRQHRRLGPIVIGELTDRNHQGDLHKKTAMNNQQLSVVKGDTKEQVWIWMGPGES